MRFFHKLLVNVLAVSAIAVTFTGCFTGVESTPKITHKDVKKQKITDTPERHALDGIVRQRPSEWRVGKKFYIADERALRGASRVEPLVNPRVVESCIATLKAIDTVPTLTGKQEIKLVLVVDSVGTEVDFNTGLTPRNWLDADAYTLPHILDLDFISEVRRRLVGSSLYILPSRRIGSGGVDTIGAKYQPVKVVDVMPATESTPIRVYLVDADGFLSSVLMTVGDETTARRNFETLFSFSDPRLRYKHISDENWSLICRGVIKEAMTPEECRLALGSPDSYQKIPTTAGMVERWTYPNGVYLLFEDGLLSKFRQ